MHYYYTVNQICEAIEAVSIDQAVLDYVHDFQNEKSRNPEFKPSKIEVTKHADRKYNLAVTAFLALEEEFKPTQPECVAIVMDSFGEEVKTIPVEQLQLVVDDIALHGLADLVARRLKTNELRKTGLSWTQSRLQAQSAKADQAIITIIRDQLGSGANNQQAINAALSAYKTV